MSMTINATFKGRPRVILEFPLNITVADATTQIAIVFDIDERNEKDHGNNIFQTIIPN